MAHVTRRVQRPALLAAMFVFAFAAQASAALGLLNLREIRFSAPAALTAETEILPDALGDAPWVGPAAVQPELWLLTRPDCRRCAEFEAGALHDLAAANVGVRVVVVAPRELGERVQEPHLVAAALARSRDWDDVGHWGRSAGRLSGVQTASFIAEPSVVEGYVEWGRASLDRVNAVLRANGVEPELPMLIWRRGSEWRVLTGERALSLEAVRRELSAEG